MCSFFFGQKKSSVVTFLKSVTFFSLQFLPDSYKVWQVEGAMSKKESIGF